MVLIRTMEAVVLLLLLFADGIPSLIALYMKLGLAKANPFPKSIDFVTSLENKFKKSSRPNYKMF